MSKLKEILVPHGVKARLKADTGCSEVTIRFALRGVIDTEKSKLIRKRALEFGGVYGR
jgi:hypothetical protein